MIGGTVPVAVPGDWEEVPNTPSIIAYMKQFTWSSLALSIGGNLVYTKTTAGIDPAPGFATKSRDFYTSITPGINVLIRQ